MSLYTNFFKIPNSSSQSSFPIAESSEMKSADKKVQFRNKDETKRRFPSIESPAIRSAQFNMTKKILSRIQSDTMKEFVKNLILNLDPQKHANPILRLKIIYNALFEKKRINLDLLTLGIINEKNPIIKALRLLDLETIDDLKKIAVPKFFQDFFEEVKYYARIEAAKQFPTPSKDIEPLIFFAENLLNIKKKPKAIKILDLAIKTADRQKLPSEIGIKLYRNAALVFFKAENKDNAINLLMKAFKLIDDCKSISGQLQAFQDLALGFAYVGARDQVIEIIDSILQISFFRSEKKILALREIFLFELENIDQMLEIIDRSKNALEKDIVLAETCELLLRDPKKAPFSLKVVKYIQDDSIRAKIFDTISKQLPDEAVLALENEKPSMR